MPPQEAQSTENTPAVDAGPAATKPPIAKRIAAEVRSRPVAYVTLAGLLVLAPILLKMIFPEATPGVLVAGTIAFTAYAAACTVPGRFL